MLFVDSTNKFELSTQGFETCRLMKTLGKFYGRHFDLIRKYCVSLCDLKADVFAYTH